MVSIHGLDMNKYIGSDFAGNVSDIVNISIEAVIAELVDNCLDAKAQKIHVELTGTNWSDFSVIVYDNSEIGFASEEDLDLAFRLAGEKDRKEGEIGSFHMGMKISTLSKFNDVSAFTKIDGEVFHRRINQNHTKSVAYEPLPDVTYARAADVYGELESGNWTTAVCLSNPPSLLFGKPGEIKAKHLEGFSRQVAMFLGITYEMVLRKNDDLSITINNQSVSPLDPFWKGFTPSKIESTLSIPSGNAGHISDAIQRNTLKCSIPWGTIATTSLQIDIEYKGEVHPLKVQGFVIPYGSVRRKLSDADLTQQVFVEKPNNAGTKTLNAEFLQGFFFYRNGRCIAFGRTGHDSNGGWYAYGAPGNNTMLGVRFKIEFGEELDDFMHLSPTKSEVLPEPNFYHLIQVAWDQHINQPLLRNKLGNGKRIFYGKTDTPKTVVGAATAPANQSKLWEDDCDYCEGFHVKGIPCHFSPCTICNSTTCEANSCKYECPYCKVVGHHVKENCSMNCLDCGLEGGHEPGESCPARCEHCQELKSNCDCPCLECGKPKLSECKCVQICEDCEQPEGKCECSQSESQYISYPEESVVEMELYKKNKIENIKYLREAIEFLGIKKEEL